MSIIPETLTEEESMKLLVQICGARYVPTGNRRQLRNYTMTLLMLDAGLRVGELVKLRVNDLVYNDIPLDSLLVLPTISKSKKQRTIPLTLRLRGAIKEMLECVWDADIYAVEKHCFYANVPQKHITERQVQRIINNASLEAFGRKVHPHVLRHTFASRLMRKTNIRVVQELLGHVSLSSTQIYTHPNSDDFKQAIADIEAPTLQA